MIKLEHVNKFFNHHKKSEIHVINDTSFELPETGLVALLGPSGCGKTTLLNAIGGLDSVNGGQIYIDGKRITNRSQRYVDKIRNGSIGYIFQDYNLINNMSVFDNVAISLKMLGIKDKEEIKRKVNYILEEIGLYRYRKRPAAMLSGGERQRVGIARAIVKDPSIIIADEPTGNLDSANSVAIMNIIKSISKNRLVILVTHETNLANFYADRIMQISDGRVIDDKVNSPGVNLDYVLDNKLYLQDFEHIDVFKNDNKNIKVYSDSKKPINLKVIVKNNNIYIQSNEKIEVIESDSNIEVIDGHQQKIDKSIYEEYDFNQDILKRNSRVKYSSIVSMWHLLSDGFEKILDYPIVKKILLFGFLASAMFVTYSVSNIFGISKIDDTKFVTMSKNYYIAKGNKYSISDYLKYQRFEGVDYLLPNTGNVSFILKDFHYYQARGTFFSISGVALSSRYLHEDDLILGRMPENEGEIVVDKFVFDTLIDTQESTKMLGFNNYKDFLNHEVSLKMNLKYTIVGVSDLKEPSIFIDDKMILSALYYSVHDGYADEDDKLLYDYKYVNVDVASGRLPLNEYEIMVSKDFEYIYPLNKTIDDKINNHKLKVVGYYKNKDFNNYIVSSKTIELLLIGEQDHDLIIMPKDVNKMTSEFDELGIKTMSSYDYLRNLYIKSRAKTVSSGIIAAFVMLIISFIEIYLMIRSSFLSRIKEVGILRAIGVKKTDIYKMFLGEILAITTLACIPGVLFMSYCIDALKTVDYIASNYMVNSLTIVVSIILLYIFNIIVGLLPVIIVVSSRPAKILARKDLD